MMADVIAYAVLIILAIVLVVFITRWVFMVDKQVRLSLAQMRLLAEIASKSGVDHKQISMILHFADTGIIQKDQGVTKEVTKQ